MSKKNTPKRYAPPAPKKAVAPAPHPVVPVANDDFMRKQELAEARMRFRSLPQNVSIPILFITQSTSAFTPDAKKHVGQIFNTHTREYSQGVEVALLSAPAESRVLYTAKFVRGAPKVCASPDGVKPYTQYVGRDHYLEDLGEFQFPETCAMCPMIDKGCNLRLNYKGVLVETMYPFLYFAERTKLDAARRLNLDLQMDEMLGMGATTWILTSEEQENDGNVYYVPKFIRGNPIESIERLPQVIERMTQYLGNDEADYETVMPEPQAPADDEAPF